MGEVERLRGLPVRERGRAVQLELFKRGLGQVMKTEGDARDCALAELEGMLPNLVYSVQADALSLDLQGWPDLLGVSDRRRLLGHHSLELLEVDQAVDLMQRVHGKVIGGSRLVLIPDLPPETVLPSSSRSRRNRSRRGGAGPWLETVDEESRLSLTPEAIAEAQAALFAAPLIIDAFGGVGGNTLAFARAGKRVWMIEPDAVRLAAAERSLVAHGIRDRVSLIHGEIEDELVVLLRSIPSAAVFLDPPWGGRDWNRQGMGWEALFGNFPGLRPETLEDHELGLKLPRSFDLSSLPEREAGWRARLEWGDSEAPPKMLTAWSPPAQSGR
jgi:hypothetical protein